MSIVRLVLRRLLLALSTLVLVSLIIFIMVEWLPGDVAKQVLGRFATAENIAMLREKLGLNVPAYIRYIHWLIGILHGNLGVTLSTARPVAAVIGPRLLNTLALGGLASLLYIPLVTIPAAIQALTRDSLLDQAMSTVTLVLYSIPDFLLGTLLLLLFVIAIPILPATSLVDQTTSLAGYAQALILPALTLGIVMAVYAVRMLRDNLIEVLDSDYVRMARLNGLPRLRVLWRHALPNALIPTINVTALNFAYLIGGVVIVEKVFSFPGFGSLLIDALLLRDVPLIEATVLIASAVYILANLIADVLAIVLNPRARQG